MEQPNGPHPEPLDAPRLLGEVMQHLSAMIRGQIDLAKQEIATKAAQAGSGLIMLGIGALLALTALNLIAAAAVAALMTAGMTLLSAIAIIGGITALIALVLLLVGVSRLKPANLRPERAMKQMRHGIDTFKEKTHV